MKKETIIINITTQTRKNEDLNEEENVKSGALEW